MQRKNLLLVIILLSISCKSRTDGSESKSGDGVSKNDELARFPYGNLATCEQHKSLPGLTKTKQYLKILASRIMQLSPDVFQGPFNPSQLCIRVYGEGLSKPAFAGMNDTVDDGLITINPFTLKEFNSDRKVAFMLAHELGHVVGLHKTPRSVYRPLVDDPNIRTFIEQQKQAEIDFHRKIINILENFKNQAIKIPFDFSTKLNLELEHSKFVLTLLVPDSEYVAHFKKVRFLEPDGYESLSGFFEFYEAHPDDAAISNLRKDVTNALLDLKKAHSLSNKYYIPEESDVRDDKERFRLAIDALPRGYKRFAEIQTWMEVEADEVGLVFYLRAGYPMNNMLGYFGNYEQSCMPDIEKGVIPNRLEIQRVLDNGLGISYTEPCWRIYNLKKRLPNLLKKQYPDLFQLGQIEPIYNPSLAEVLEEVEVYR